MGRRKCRLRRGRGRFLTLRGVGDAAPTGEGVFRLRRGRGSFTPLRGYTSSAPCGGTFPSRGRLVATIFYKPIDIVGFVCYHAITYKKDMLKE